MWNWFNCYLSGRHDYGMWCESGAIFLRCVHCGRRSSGWAVHQAVPVAAAKPAAQKAKRPKGARVAAFERRTAT
jgi:hypothetical protein